MAQIRQDAAAQAVKHLNDLGKPADRARVLVMGIGCGGSCSPQKPCTIRSLRGTGALVDFYDPNLAEARCGGLRARGISVLTPSALRRYDMVILQQPCTRQDYLKVTASARWLLDVRPDPKDCII